MWIRIEDRGVDTERRQPPARTQDVAVDDGGVSSVRFGREVLVYSAAEAPPEAPASEVARRHAWRRTDATPDQLRIVVQHGRRFQQHHPQVPVLHDRGRFLLVRLDDESSRRVVETTETCYGLLPVSPDMVVFDERAPTTNRARDPVTAALTERITRAEARATLERFVAFRTRHSTSAEFASAAALAAERLGGMGYTTTVVAVPVGSRRSQNVIAEKPGTGSAPRGVILVTAHLDSINASGGSGAPAPGADDNASGSAGVIEIARVFESVSTRHDLRFILFGGEEQGLFGSQHYVESLDAAERSRIRAVVNMDMIGSLNSATRSVLLEGAALSQSVMDGLADAAALYTSLVVETSLHPFNSDHVPFIDRGVPAVLAIEGADNTNDRVHSADDTADRIDYDLLVDILRMNVAFIADAAGRV